MVCGTLGNLVKELMQWACGELVTSCSGRSILVSGMDRLGYDLKTIQTVLGHPTPDMTLVNIDAREKRIEQVFKSTSENRALPNLK